MTLLPKETWKAKRFSILFIYKLYFYFYKQKDKEQL